MQPAAASFILSGFVNVYERWNRVDLGCRKFRHNRLDCIGVEIQRLSILLYEAPVKEIARQYVRIIFFDSL
jgi:hypothetical protein